MRHIAKNVLQAGKGERYQYMTAKISEGMVRLDQGCPSFITPPHICRAADEALKQGLTLYAPGRGDPEFLTAVSEKIDRETGAKYSNEELLATHGATSAIYAVFTTLLDPGDEVILLDPTYSLYEPVATQLGAKAIQVPLTSDWHLDIDAIRNAAGPRTRLVMFNNPNNPTGTVFHRTEIEALAVLCAERNMLLVSDEAYEKILQPGYEHVPLLSLQAHRDRLILIGTFSKTYAMTGWRLGYIAAPKDLSLILLGVHRAITSTICTFVQRAGAAALRGPQDCVEEMRAEYHRRGSVMHQLALSIPGLIPNAPQGTFYLFCRYEFPIPSAELNQRLWEAGVATNSGSMFGPSGESHLRFSYAVTESEIVKGMEIVRKVFSRLG